MSEYGVAKDVADALRPRQVLIPTPYVHEHSISDSPEQNARDIYDIFLPLDGSGAHFMHAHAWAHTRTAKTVDPKLFFFTFLLLMCETTKEGSYIPKADKDVEPKVYENTVYLSALQALNRATIAQQTALRQLLEPSRYVDLRYHHDVEERKIWLSQQPRKTPAPKKKKDDDGEAKDDKGKEEEEEELPPPPPDVSDPGPEPPEPDFAWLKDFARGKRFNVAYNDERILESGRQSQTRLRWAQNKGKKPPPPEQPKKASSKKRDAPEEGGYVMKPYPEGAPVRQAKVDFTVTPIPVRGGNIKVQQQVAGVYCRFIVHDPLLNPGKFFESILSNLYKRLASYNSRSQNRGFEELFPQYAPLYYSQHPAGNAVSQQTYFNAVLAIKPDLKKPGVSDLELFKTMNYCNKSNPMHLCQVLTTERAVEDMKKANAAPQFTQHPREWFDIKSRTALFPLKSEVPTYKYHPFQVFWFSHKHIGLSEQYFPHIDLDTDFLSTLMSGGNVNKFLDLQELQNKENEKKDINNAFQEIKNLISNHFLVERHLLHDKTLVKYDTPNEFVHLAAEAELMNNRINEEYPTHFGKTMDDVLALKKTHADAWEAHANDPDLKRRIFECRKYSALRTKAQEARTKIFCSLWVTEGNIDELPIPKPTKEIQKWYRDRKGKFPNLTREYMMWDATIGLFGNSMLRQLKMYACVARIIQPLVCLIAEGLFSCYHWGPSELAFNMLAHGKYDVGKTFAAITTLMRYTTIQGTVEEYCVATGASDTTMNHSYDLIIASDEVMPWKVNSAEAAKVPTLVNKEKVKMTRRQIGLKAFSFEKGPNGESIRWQRNVTTDHYVTLVEVTNNTVEAVDALSSRYHRMTIAQPRIPAREFAGFMGATLKSSAMTYLQINQYLSAWAYKGAMVGAILPEPEMSLFHDISNRVIDYLQATKAISGETGSRGIEIMKPYARQLVYHMAIHCCFDMPGGPCYGKKFDPSMLKYLQPYLYCTVEIVWWCWTALASGWIEEQNSNVIRAACRVVGVEWEDGVSPYAIYEHDKNDTVRWRLRKNTNYTGEKGGQDEQLVDLQYIMLEGTLEAVCRQIAEKTNPHLAYTDVMGVLNVLETVQMAPPNGGFVPQPKGTFKEWHKYIELPVRTADGSLMNGIKKVDDADLSRMPAVYKLNNPNSRDFRGEDDVPKLPEGASFTVVDKSDLQQKKLYIMPNVATSFRNRTILEALAFATICRTFPPGKMLLGLPSDHDCTQLQVFNCSDALIANTIAALDEDEGWGVDEAGEPIWLGDPEVPENERPVSRRVGIQFNRRGGISKSDSIFFNTVPSVPVAENDTSWKEKCAQDLAGMEKVRDVYADLDYESAKRQHMACGKGVDEDIETPTYIYNRYVKACNQRGRPPFLDFDYPHDGLAEYEERQSVWTASTASVKASKRLRDVITTGVDNSVARKPDTAAAIAKRNEKKRSREGLSTSLSAATFIPAMIPSAPPPPQKKNKSSRAKTSKKLAEARQHASAPAPPSTMSSSF